MPPEFENEVIQLDLTRGDGTVVVTPKDQDRYILRLERAVDLLKRGAEFDVFSKQVNLMLREIADWLSHRPDIRDGYLTLRDGAFLFVVVKSAAGYDADFEDALGDLELAIANDKDLSLIKFSALAVPPVSEGALSQFLNSEFTLQFDCGSRV